MAEEGSFGQQPRIIVEDFSYGSGATYTTGGNYITVKNALTLDKLLCTQSVSVTSAAVQFVWTPVNKSEAVSSLGAKVQVWTAAGGSGLIELFSSGSISGQIVRLTYQGT